MLSDLMPISKKDNDGGKHGFKMIILQHPSSGLDHIYLTFIRPQRPFGP